MDRSVYEARWLLIGIVLLVSGMMAAGLAAG